MHFAAAICLENTGCCAQMHPGSVFLLFWELSSESKKRANTSKLWYLRYFEEVDEKEALQRRAKVEFWPNYTTTFVSLPVPTICMCYYPLKNLAVKSRTELHFFSARQYAGKNRLKNRVSRAIKSCGDSK